MSSFDLSCAMAEHPETINLNILRLLYFRLAFEWQFLYFPFRIEEGEKTQLNNFIFESHFITIYEHSPIMKWCRKKWLLTNQKPVIQMTVYPERWAGCSLQVAEQTEEISTWGASLGRLWGAEMEPREYLLTPRFFSRLRPASPVTHISSHGAPLHTEP